MNQDNDRDLEIIEQTEAPEGLRGKYYASYKEGTKVVLLALDVAEFLEHGAPPVKKG